MRTKKEIDKRLSMAIKAKGMLQNDRQECINHGIISALLWVRELEDSDVLEAHKIINGVKNEFR